MNQRCHNLIFILSLTKTLLRNNGYYAIIWLFMRYARRKLDRLLNKQSQIQCLPDEILEKLIEQNDDVSSRNYIGRECYAFGESEGTEIDTARTWHYICSKVSKKKYKVWVLPYNECRNGTIIVSETMRHNIYNALGHQPYDRSYFLMPTREEVVLIAADARISMISNSYDCSSDSIDCLVKTYFRVPRYARNKHLFAVDVKKYAPHYFYASGKNCPRRIHFRVDALRVKHKNKIESTNQCCYIVTGETRLSRSSNIFTYYPPEFWECTKMEVGSSVRCQMEMCSRFNCPPCLEKPLSSLLACVSPFLRKDIKLTIRPVFLIKGAPGSGKFKLVECVAKRNGLNLLNVDCSEIQCPSAAQTEAKLRIILRNALTSVPCILRLSNIQIFGKNSEGKKDERLVYALASEFEKLNETTSTSCPVIVMASLENDELDADVQRLFIETISIVHPNKSERAQALSWLLETKGLRYRGNLESIAGLVSDFGLADLESLTVQTTKIAYESSPTVKRDIPLTLADDNFVQARELMQSSFSDRVGAPSIPKVYWEDIGGLASLKHEIKRRIELPMFHRPGLGRSGLLLYGPPGTGKTLLAKAVATECQLHFMSVKGPELLNMYVGQSEKNIRQVFERARAAAPCVIFFDELDSLAPNRGRSGDSGGVMDRVVSQLLAEMDGLESSGNISIIAATNRLDLIDPALLRPGRFDKMLYVGIYEDRDSQLSVLRAVTRRLKMKNDGEELREIVEKLPKNTTGADLYALCSDAWLSAVRRYLTNLDRITDETTKDTPPPVSSCQNLIVVEVKDFFEAAQSLVPSLSDAELTSYEKVGRKFRCTR